MSTMRIKPVQNTGTGLDILSPSQFLIDYVNIPVNTLTSDNPVYDEIITDYNNVNLNWKTNVSTNATDNLLVVNGFAVIRNSGNQTATICNCLVNLQKTIAGKWRSISDATKVDTATCMANLAFNSNTKTVNIASGASSEARSSFSRSNTLVKSSNFFYISEDTTVTSFVKGTDGLKLNAGEIKALAFNCVFNAKELNVKPGDSLRAEFICTFDNAGARGGSGSSVSSLEVDGFTGNELNVRSIPERYTFTVPALKTGNENLTLTFDSNQNNTAIFTYNGDTLFNINVLPNTSVSTDFNISGLIKDGDDNINNPMTFEVFTELANDGESYEPLVWTNINYPTLSFSYQFTRFEKLKQKFNYHIKITPEIPPSKESWDIGDLLTYNKKDFSTKLTPLAFSTYYPNGLSFKYNNNYVLWNNLTVLKNYLGYTYRNNETKLNNSITTNGTFQSVNPSTTISKNYLQQLVALTLNIDLSVGENGLLKALYETGKVKIVLPSSIPNPPSEQKIYNIIQKYGLNDKTISEFRSSMEYYLWTDHFPSDNPEILNDYALLAEGISESFRTGNSGKGHPSSFSDKFMVWY